MVSDLAVGVLSLWLAFVIRIYIPLPLTETLLPRDRLAFLVISALLIATTQNAAMYFLGFYDVRRPLPRLKLLRRLMGAATLQGFVLSTFFFLTAKAFPRSIIVIFVPLNILFLFVFRLILQRVSKPTQLRVAIVGCDPGALEVARDIERYGWQGFEVAGFVTLPGRDEPPDLPRGSEYLGTTKDLPHLLEIGKVDVVLLASAPDDWQTRLLDDLNRVHSRGSVLLLPTPFESLIGRARFRSIHDLALVEVVREGEWVISRPIKRAFDTGAALLLFLLSLPVWAIVALVIKLSSPGSVLYFQERVGADRQTFTLIKFRTMRADAESDTGAVLAARDDPRVTMVGRTLRRFRLDELPQLVNVLRGEMSLVGPRPERAVFVEQHLEDIPGYAERFSVPPGLTGLAQVNGDYFSSPENKLRYDLAYIANWNPWLDLSILFRTVKIMLSSSGS